MTARSTSKPGEQLALPVGAKPRRGVARVRRGVDDTVSALRSTGRLEQVDAATVALARTLADALDAEATDPDGSRYTVGALAGRLLPVLQDLRGPVVADDLGVLAGLSASMGDGPLP